MARCDRVRFVCIIGIPIRGCALFVGCICTIELFNTIVSKFLEMLYYLYMSLECNLSHPGATRMKLKIGLLFQVVFIANYFSLAGASDKKMVIMILTVLTNLICLRRRENVLQQRSNKGQMK